MVNCVNLTFRGGFNIFVICWKVKEKQPVDRIRLAAESGYAPRISEMWRESEQTVRNGKQTDLCRSEVPARSESSCWLAYSKS